MSVARVRTTCVHSSCFTEYIPVLPARVATHGTHGTQ